MEAGASATMNDHGPTTAHHVLAAVKRTLTLKLYEKLPAKGVMLYADALWGRHLAGRIERGEVVGALLAWTFGFRRFLQKPLESMESAQIDFRQLSMSWPGPPHGSPLWILARVNFLFSCHAGVLLAAGASASVRLSFGAMPPGRRLRGRGLLRGLHACALFGQRQCGRHRE